MPVSAISAVKFHRPDQYATGQVVAGDILDAVAVHQLSFFFAAVPALTGVDQEAPSNLGGAGAVLDLLDPTPNSRA